MARRALARPEDDKELKEVLSMLPERFLMKDMKAFESARLQAAGDPQSFGIVSDLSVTSRR